MVIQKTPTKIDKIVSLRIGQHQENAATQIKMDVSDWITVHPTAGFHILFKRPGEVQAQPVLSSLEEGILTWTVQEWETSLIGVGYAEVRAIEAESALVAKSRVIPCAIEESIAEDGDVPPEYSGWVEQVLAAGETAEAAKEAAEAAKEAAETARDEAQEAAAGGIDDFSLTANKLVKGTLGYVIPQQFGAKGDGVTDDSLAMKECITFARENNYAVFLPQGTYIVRHGQLAQTISDGQSIIIIGSGQNSIVKRMDDSLPEYQDSTVWARLFTIINGPQSAPAHDVIFANFCIDSNRRNQSNATSGYTHESSADISIRNSADIGQEQYLDRFIIENMRFYDPVADCVNISGTSQNRINHVIIDKMIATDRHGTRNDIGFTASSIGETIISNCICGSIHFEFNYSPIDEEVTTFNIHDCTFDHMSLASRINLIMSGNKINKSLILESLENANISNCEFVFAGTGSYIRNVKIAEHPCLITFNDCLFTSVLANDSATNLNVRYGLDTYFKNCRFKYIGELNVDDDEDGVNDHVAGQPVYREGGSSGEMVMDGCSVDPSFRLYAWPYCSNATIKNCEIGTWFGVSVGSVSGHMLDSIITFENVRLLDSCKSAIQTYSVADERPITVNGEVICSRKNFSIYVSPGANGNVKFFNNVHGSFHRIVKMDVPFSFENIKDYLQYNSYSNKYPLNLRKDDLFVYAGETPSALPIQWRITQKNYLNTTNGEDAGTYGIPLSQNVRAEGVAFGTVLKRPSCLLNPGFSYFDTSLNQMVIWDGTKWINPDGTPALGYTITDGDAARVLTDVETDPINEFKITFAPKQSGTGDPSPENIRPITGWTGCNLYQTGENLITTTPLRKIQGARINAETKQIVTDNYTSSFVYPVPKGTLYATKESSKEFWYGTSDNPELVINDYVEQALYYRYGTQTTIDNEHGYLYASGAKGATYADKSSLAYGMASATMLEPGTGETIAIVFGDGNTAYYGGYVDVLTSTLYVTHGYIASYAGETLPGRWISDRDVYAEGTVPTTGAEVAYELAEPTTVSLTSIEFELMSGVNTLWADTNGSIRVGYWHH